MLRASRLAVGCVVVAVAFAPLVEAATVFQENFNAWPPAGFLNQDWSNDAQVGCDLARNNDGRWGPAGGWARANMSTPQGNRQDSRLITPVITVGSSGFNVTFDFDYLEEGDGSIDYAQLIVVNMIGGTFPTCAINANCSPDSVEVNDGDSIIFCRTANSFQFAKTVSVPSSVASGTIRLMFRYFNDQFRATAPGYFRVDNLLVDATTTPPGDTIPPTTTANVTGPYCNPTWYNGPVTVTLNATDNPGGSGVASTHYSVDGGAFQTYTAPFQVTGDGTHTVRFFSRDNAGNVEATRSVSFTIDATPPTTSIALSGPQSQTDRLYVRNTTLFSLGATDAVSGVNRTEYRIDNGTWTDYTAPFNLDGPDGPRNITYRSGDRACNLEGERTLAVFLDDTQPRVFIEQPTTLAGAANPLLGQLGSLCGQVFQPPVCALLPQEVDLGTAVGPVASALGTVATTVDQTCQALLQPALCGTALGPVQTVQGLLAGLGGSNSSGTAVAHGNVTVRANATDPLVNGGASGVGVVEFYLDGALRATDSVAPYEWAWDSSQEPQGQHELRVVARDRVENWSETLLTVLVV